MRFKITLLNSLFLLFSMLVFSQQGALDPTFGEDGIVITDLNQNEFVFDMVIQPDGKILVLGGMLVDSSFGYFIARYLPNGSLDMSFNNVGYVQDTFGPYQDVMTRISLLPDGSFFISGRSIQVGSQDDKVVALKFDEVGQQLSGVWINTTSGNDVANGAVLQTDEKLLITGASPSSTGNSTDISLIRILSNGLPDASFGNNGRITTHVGSNYNSGSAVKQLLNGKIIVAGETREGTSNNNIVLLRYNSNGTLDTSFGNSGYTITDTGSLDDKTVAMQELNNGNILLGAFNGTNSILLEYTNNGALNTNFGTGGMVTTNTEGIYGVMSLYIRDGSKILMSGFNTDTNQTSLVLFQFHSNGELDESFGNSGMISISLNAIPAFTGISGIKLQNDGMAVLAYSSLQPSDIVLARYFISLELGIVDFNDIQLHPLIYPNPIASETTLEYTLSQAETISITLYDFSGKLIRTFLSSEGKEAGDHKHTLAFDGIATGNYVLKLSNGSATRTIQLIKK
ncbi:T9SS type A sorting domain-containing protein [Altibacter sp.]|uniref:T9SS type A sorting domain-containing protein n=1 Tax=Altibacter sp. TaxID=2024823 RepID=UPI000C9254ED|nr:T9SS type A sorting domain-containing protein [Altibacter sp.]MAP55232.1 hypothetical protein [Altibacter sp.]